MQQAIAQQQQQMLLSAQATPNSASNLCGSVLWGGNNRCEIITNVRKFICIFCTSLRQEQTQCATKDYRRIFVLFLQASLSVSQAVCEITKFTTDNLRVKTTKSSKINQQLIVCCIQCVQKLYIYEIVQNWAGG